MIEITLKKNNNKLSINIDIIGVIYTDKGDTCLELNKMILDVTTIVVKETEDELRNLINILKYEKTI